MTTGIFELTVVILTAAALGIVSRLLKQPIILAYIFAGVLIGYFGFFNLGNKGTFELFSDLGIMFLLFLIGMEINFPSLRLVGKTSLVVGIGQIVYCHNHKLRTPKCMAEKHPSDSAKSIDGNFHRIGPISPIGPIWIPPRGAHEVPFLPPQCLRHR